MYRMIIVWIALVIFLCTIITLRFAAWAKRLRRPYTVGFLHPNCHKKGGGERVLWLAVRSLLEKDSALQVVVYCSPAAAANADAMYDSLDSDLGICLRPVFSPRITLVPVRFTSYIDSNFPFCTILFQSLAGIPLSIHCMISHLPSLFIDTRGCPLSSIAPFFLGCSCPAIRIFSTAMHMHRPYDYFATDALRRLWCYHVSLQPLSAFTTATAFITYHCNSCYHTPLQLL
jgi:hypothetical protein